MHSTPLAFAFSSLFRMLSLTIPALTSHFPVSPIIPALTEKRGVGGTLPHEAFSPNSFVFFPCVNYMGNYMNNYIVGAPTFCGHNMTCAYGNGGNPKTHSLLACPPEPQRRRVTYHCRYLLCYVAVHSPAPSASRAGLALSEAEEPALSVAEGVAPTEAPQIFHGKVHRP